MIYVDTSVALARLLADDRRSPAKLWDEDLVSSRLLEYELWTRLNARALGSTHGEAAHALVGRLALLELSSPVLTRALAPFPVAVRTLDALHLASVELLRGSGQSVQVATYDQRLRQAAEAMGITIAQI